MSALITLAILVVVALWAMATYGRLVRLRKMVTIRWRAVAAARQRGWANPGAPAVSEEHRAETDTALEEARLHYNLVATKYNAAITGIPGSIVAAAAGFRHAELLSPEEVVPVTTPPSPA